MTTLSKPSSVVFVPALSDRTISQLSTVIRKDWAEKTYYSAKPYVEAMLSIGRDDQIYGCESAKDVVLGFLANAGSWRGEHARQVKAELKRRFNIT